MMTIVAAAKAGQPVSFEVPPGRVFLSLSCPVDYASRFGGVGPWGRDARRTTTNARRVEVVTAEDAPVALAVAFEGAAA